MPLALTFWTYVSHDATREIAPETAWASLQELHRALRQYPGFLPFMGVVMDEIPHWIKWLEVRHR